MSGTQKAIPGLFQAIVLAAGGISALLELVVIVTWLRFTVPLQIARGFPAIRTALVLKGLLFALAIALMVKLARIAYRQAIRLESIQASPWSKTISDCQRFDSYNISSRSITLNTEIDNW